MDKLTISICMPEPVCCGKDLLDISACWDACAMATRMGGCFRAVPPLTSVP